ncbi:fasciclin domain-containing protein [Chitinophaga vietnamensis]|uniref:fasciclin domain-containing protein n=1 Tax=Chitinophaga vietnamensis TaxID=2593957 RepID=UPI00117770E8|nr:fasciclin domain-containing protein [Chitinophaga vietnamensis]
MKKQYFIYASLLVMLLMAACRQKDAQVAPVGKPLEYKGPQKTIRQLLDSTNFSIYKAMWKIVNMDSVIQAQTLQGYTLLVPTDEAFKAFGITAGNISSLDATTLDTLLRYHIIDSWLPGDRIRSIAGNMSLHSLLRATDFGDYNSWSFYTYLQYLGVHNGKLMINGKPHPLNTLEATNGTIYVIDEVLQKPQQDMIDYLSNNPDFTFLMEAFRLNDSVYQSNWGQPLFTQQLLSSTQRFHQLTLFAPTNHAFQQAGFKTLDDLRQRANLYPVGYPYYDDNQYYQWPLTSLDSLLSVNRLDYNGAATPDYPMQLFSNDLTDNPALANYLIKAGSPSHNGPQNIRLMFGMAGGSITAKQLGASTPALPLLSTDLLFRNGVIHVINDGLFGR